MKSITLYEVQNPLWLTEAHVADNGDLVITSGDKDNEWSQIVPAGHKSALLNALTRYVSLDSSLALEPDTQLLRALSAMFAGDQNPFEDIKAFLERHAIPANDSNWLW